MKNASLQLMAVSFDSCSDINGLNRDFNHYTTVSKKLQGTNDRVISLRISDIYRELNKRRSDKH